MLNGAGKKKLIEATCSRSSIDTTITIVGWKEFTNFGIVDNSSRDFGKKSEKILAINCTFCENGAPKMLMLLVANQTK